MPKVEGTQMTIEVLKLLSSGLLGAIVAQLLMIVHSWRRGRKERKSLLMSIRTECKYNLGIIDEVAGGAISGGSFKRLSVDYLKWLRERITTFENDRVLFHLLSRVCVDMDLFNLEVSYVFDGDESVCNYDYTDNICKLSVEIAAAKKKVDISTIINSARVGVRVSLEELVKTIDNKIGKEKEN